MKFVYRIENKDGVGPWRCDDEPYEGAWDKLRDHAYNKSLPSPVIDNDRKVYDYNVERLIDSGYVCGAPTIKNLKKWFPKRIRDKLIQSGFKVHRYNFYDIQDCVELKTQVVMKIYSWAKPLDISDKFL